MKILLDECVPWPLRHLLVNHSCTNAQTKGWGGLRNGELLDRAEAEFHLFISSDQNIRYQQNLSERRIAILVISTNDIQRLRAADELVQDAVNKIQPADFIQLNIP